MLMFGKNREKNKKDRSLDRKIRNEFYEHLLVMPIEERMM